jgi:hypothetical protein
MVVGSAYTGYALYGSNDTSVVPEPSSSLICLLFSSLLLRSKGWKFSKRALHTRTQM